MGLCGVKAPLSLAMHREKEKAGRRQLSLYLSSGYTALSRRIRNRDRGSHWSFHSWAGSKPALHTLTTLPQVREKTTLTHSYLVWHRSRYCVSSYCWEKYFLLSPEVGSQLLWSLIICFLSGTSSQLSFLLIDPQLVPPSSQVTLVSLICSIIPASSESISGVHPKAPTPPLHQM